MNSNDTFLKAIYWTGLIAMLLSWVLAFYYLPQLPDQIPSHFNSRGEVDGYSSKYIVFLMPLIATLIWALMRFLGDKPNLYNYPVKITEFNKDRQFALAKMFMQVLNSMMCILFLYIEWTMIQAGLHGETAMSMFFVYGIAGLIVLLSLGYFQKAKSIE